MSGVLVDSSVLIDVVTDDPVRAATSQDAILRVGRERELIVNPIIFAEVSIPFARVEDIDERLTGVFRREDIPWEAAFLAG